MRQITFILALLLGFSALGQEPSDYHFIIDESAGSVIWQRVYDGECDVAEVAQALLAAPAFNINSFDDSVACDYRFEDLAYKSLGYTWGGRSIFVRHPQVAHVVVQVKPGRYRVTVSNITCHIDGVGDLPLDNMSVVHTGDYSPKYRTITMHILDYNYSRAFARLASSDLGDDW